MFLFSSQCKWERVTHKTFCILPGQNTWHDRAQLAESLYYTLQCMLIRGWKGHQQVCLWFQFFILVCVVDTPQINTWTNNEWPDWEGRMLTLVHIMVENNGKRVQICWCFKPSLLNVGHHYKYQLWPLFQFSKQSFWWLTHCYRLWKRHHLKSDKSRQ